MGVVNFIVQVRVMVRVRAIRDRAMNLVILG